MYFEKGPVKPTEITAPAIPARRGWIVAAGLLLLAAAGIQAFRYATDVEPYLAEARRLLVSRVTEFESAAPSRSVQRAAESLKTYLRDSGHAQNSAKLLLLICDWQSGMVRDAGQELDRINLAECLTSELVSAAMAAFQAKDFLSADRLIAAALERSGVDRERTLRAAAVIRFDIGRREDVLTHCRELALLAPTDPRPWMVITSVYEGRGEWASVVENYRQVLARTQGEKLEERSIMIGFLLQSSNLEEARREFDALSKQAPEVAKQLPVLQAKLLFQEGHAEQALPYLARALRDKPDDHEALFLRGRIQLERGEFAGAIKSLERVVEIEPLGHESRYVLSQAYHRAGRKADGEKMLDAYRDLEVFKQRLYVLERIANSDPQDRQSREELVKMFDRLGAQTQAEYWRRSLGQQATGAQESKR